MFEELHVSFYTYQEQFRVENDKKKRQVYIVSSIRKF